MSLNEIIPPEVFNDAFSKALSSLAAREDIRTFLEIGSSSGGGSTQALVQGIEGRSDLSSVRMFCMEVSRERYFSLFQTYKEKKFLKAYNLSSVALSDFPDPKEIEHFYKHTNTNLNKYPIHQVLDWLRQDIAYIEDNCLNFNGIEFIKAANRIVEFDFVLIDGSEFTGERELQYVWGAKFIALDDVNAFKCFAPYVRLSNHYGYKKINENLTLRNGFAVFERNF